MNTKIVSLNTPFINEELKYFYFAYKNEINSYVMMFIDTKLFNGYLRSSVLNDLVPNLWNVSLGHLLDSFNWARTGSQAHYYVGVNGVITNTSFERITLKEIVNTYKDVVDLNRKFFPDRETAIQKEVSFVNSAGKEITLTFVKTKQNEIFYPDVTIGDENSNYFMVSDEVFEVDLFHNPKSNYSQNVIDELKGLGEGFLNKLISIPRNSKDYLTFVDLDEGAKIKGLTSKFTEVSLNFTRYISKFPDIFSNQDCELLAAHLKSMHEFKVEIVSGADIVKYYDERSYTNSKSADNSPLHKSCMRYTRRRRMLDLYVNNPSTVKLVVVLQGGLVCARALLWKTDQGITLLDRIYYDTEKQKAFVISQANLNGWYYKTKQDAKSPRNISFNGVELPSKFLSVSLELAGINHYPYLDTFYYINSNGKKLYNSSIGSSIRVLHDQYGTFPLGWSADSPENAVAEPATDYEGNLIEVGTYWPSLNEGLSKNSKGQILNHYYFEISENKLNTLILDFPYENKYGFKSDTFGQSIINFLQGVSLNFYGLPTLSYLSAVKAVAYTDLLTKEVILSREIKNIAVFEDLSPKEVLHSLQYGSTLILLSPSDQVDLAERYGLSPEAKLDSYNWLVLDRSSKKAVLNRTYEYTNVEKLITYKSFLSLIELDPEIYMRVVSSEIYWSRLYSEYLSLMTTTEEEFDNAFTCEEAKEITISTEIGDGQAFLINISV